MKTKNKNKSNTQRIKSLKKKKDNVGKQRQQKKVGVFCRSATCPISLKKKKKNPLSDVLQLHKRGKMKGRREGREEISELYPLFFPSTATSKVEAPSGGESGVEKVVRSGMRKETVGCPDGTFKPTSVTN